MKDLVSKQGEVNEIIDEGNHFIDDKTVPDTERKKVHEKMVILHDDWNKLATLTSGKHQRLVLGVAVVKHEAPNVRVALRSSAGVFRAWRPV